MKRCPTCNKTFSDQNLSFCIEDGTPLVPLAVDETPNDGPASANAGSSTTSGAQQPSHQLNDVRTPAYQPPGSYFSPGQSGKRKVWPWVVAILGISLIGVVGMGIAIAIFLPRAIRSRSEANANVERRETNSSNLNDNTATSHSSPSNESSNVSRDSETESITPAPTNEDLVLSALTDLEQEWTVANINADKKKLDLILADDYVGTASDGKKQGKAEYIRTIERDTTIQKWDFQDLKVALTGERATLTGIIKLQVRNQAVAYQFTDKFVWRNGRWQATGSAVTPIK